MAQPDQFPRFQPAVPAVPTGFPAPTAPVVPTGGPVATGLAMRNRNPVLVWLLWPLLTLGIYHLVWYYKIHKEMAQFDPRRVTPVAGPMLVLLFLSWTFVAPLVSYYNCGTRIQDAQRATGRPVTCSPVVGMLLMLVFGAGTLYYQAELNKICDLYDVPEGTQVALFA